jgi:hypothetical protein
MISVLIKMKLKTEDALSVAEQEQRSVKWSLKHASHEPEEGKKKDIQLSFAERELKRQRLAKQKSSTRYIDTTRVTDFKSDERLFSMAKRVYNRIAGACIKESFRHYSPLPEQVRYGTCPCLPKLLMNHVDPLLQEAIMKKFVNGVGFFEGWSPINDRNRCCKRSVEG